MSAQSKEDRTEELVVSLNEQMQTIEAVRGKAFAAVVKVTFECQQLVLLANILCKNVNADFSGPKMLDVLSDRLAEVNMWAGRAAGMDEKTFNDAVKDGTRLFDQVGNL